MTIDIGSRRELFLDDHLIENTDGVELRLHRPTPRDVAIVHDRPWEGNTCFYHTVFRDGDRVRMYHRGSHSSDNEKLRHQVVCYAESGDGKTFSKPELGIVDFDGSKANNVVWDDETGSHNFAPFRDDNPRCDPAARYKAMGSKGMEALYAFKSSDGIHWSFLRQEPVVTDGAFDSQNLAFWDAERGLYVDYHRDFYVVDGEKIRGIRTATSADFLAWTEPVWLNYGAAPHEHLYINQITPYYRAPQIYLGFPKRYMPKRAESDGGDAGLSDSVFMSSRDGLHFRRWGEAFIRPGPQQERWINRNNQIAWGLIETEADVPGTPPEISVYSMEGYYRGDSCQLRRYTLRLDGFVSANAPLRGGELITRPFTFAGTELSLNYATSAAGSLRVEIQEESGQAVEGFAMAECEEIYGDDVDHVVRWESGSDAGALSGKPVRLRFALSDADLYSLVWR